MGACSLLAESPSLTLPQGAHALRKLTAEAVDVVVRVDVIARTTQAPLKIQWGLLPRFAGRCQSQSVREPCHRSLVEHELLQVSWLSRGIFSHEGLEAIRLESRGVCACDLAIPDVEEAFALCL